MLGVYKKAIAAAVGLAALFGARYGIDLPQEALIEVLISLVTLAGVVQLENKSPDVKP